MNKKWILVLNPKGAVVEVDEDRWPDLEHRGYKLLSRTSESKNYLAEKKKVKFNMPINVNFPYDGYGRLGTLFSNQYEFDPDSDTIVLIGRPNPFDQGNKKVILFTMFEADRIPPRWADYCNKAVGLIVPTVWVKEVFQKAGVTVPIEVVNLATENFRTIKPNNEEFRFLHFNSFVEGDQKGWKLVLRAFLNLFKEDSNAHLYLKGNTHRWANDMEWLPQVRNVHYITENMQREQFELFVENTNCFVYPSRGEGFGLPPLEMMARGVPTILTNAHSLKTFAKHGIPIGVTKEKMPCYYIGRVWDYGIGDWVVPDFSQLERKMWDVYNNYDKYKAEAEANQSIIKKGYSLSVMFKNFEKAVEKLSK